MQVAEMGDFPLFLVPYWQIIEGYTYAGPSQTGLISMAFVATSRKRAGEYAST